jgi:hypothetical protein
MQPETPTVEAAASLGTRALTCLEVSLCVSPRRAPGRPPFRPARRRTCVGRGAVVPRWHLLRQHAVILGRLLKVAARPCARQTEPPILAAPPAMNADAAQL